MMSFRVPTSRSILLCWSIWRIRRKSARGRDKYRPDYLFPFPGKPFFSGFIGCTESSTRVTKIGLVTKADYLDLVCLKLKSPTAFIMLFNVQ